MRTIGLTSLLVILSFMLFGQDYTINWSEHEVNAAAKCNVISIEGEHYYYTRKKRKKGYFLIKCNKETHQIIEETELFSEYNGEKIDFNDVIKTKSGQYMQFSYLDKKTNEFQLLMSKLENGESGELKKKYAHAFDMREFFMGGKNNFNIDRANNLVVSTAKNYVGFYNKVSNVDDDNKKKGIVSVFDNKLNLIWEQSLSFDYQANKIVIQQTVVDNNGNVYLLGLLTGNHGTTEERRASLIDPLYEDFRKYKIFKVTNNSFKEIKLPLENEAIVTSMTLHFPAQETEGMVVTGFLKQKEGAGSGGIFYSKETANGFGKIQLKTFDSFTNELNQLSEPKQKNEERVYHIHTTINFGDGTFGFVAKAFRYIPKPKDKAVRHRSRNTIVTRFSATGELIFSKVIDNTTRYNSLIHLQDEKVYLVYSHLKRKDNSKKLVETTELIVLTNEGEEILNKTLFAVAEKKLRIVPVASYTKYDEMLLHFNNLNGRFAFGLIEL